MTVPGPEPSGDGARIGLDDNTRDALHFVVLGAAVLLVLRLLVAGVVMLLDAQLTAELAVSIAGFRNGYLLRDPQLLVTGGMELPGRLASAAIAAVCAGVCLALLFGAGARVLGGDVQRSALRGGRTGLVLVGVWCFYAVLFLPARGLRVDGDVITVIHRKALLDALSAPWPATEHVVPWNAITGFERRTIMNPVAGCGTEEQVVMLTINGEQVVASITPRGADCVLAERDAVDRTTRLATLLHAADHR